MEKLRKPFEGVSNIIRFNWHYFLLALVAMEGLLIAGNFVPESFGWLLVLLALFAFIATISSLVVSYYVYDWSDLYKLNWLGGMDEKKGETIVNIHAGFDETTSLLKERFPKSNLLVFDFFDPLKHTEISIKRARKSRLPYPGTQRTNTYNIPLPTGSIDKVFLLLAAHEIRDEQERITFFKELERLLKPTGKIIITEHLRDLPNFLAYNIGAFHFHSEKTWLSTFENTDLKQADRFTITPFINAFILTKNGNPS